MYYAENFPPTSGADIGFTSHHIASNTPRKVISKLEHRDRALFLSSLAMDAATAPNALEFRKAVSLKLAQQPYAPSLRRALMIEAIDVYGRRPKTKQPPRFGQTVEALSKSMPRGGNYHKRITRPGGRHVYVYSDAEYRQRTDAHVDGKAARSDFLRHHVQRVLEKSGEDGCPIESFKDLVQKHGPKAVARALNAHKVDFDGTHVRPKAGKSASST